MNNFDCTSHQNRAINVNFIRDNADLIIFTTVPLPYYNSFIDLELFNGLKTVLSF